MGCFKIRKSGSWQLQEGILYAALLMFAFSVVSWPLGPASAKGELGLGCGVIGLKDQGLGLL